MISKKVANYKELNAALAELHESRLKQEDLLKQNVSGIKEALNPLSIAKGYLKSMVADKELHRDAMKAGLSMGAQYIIEKLFKTNKSAKRHFTANIFEKLVTKLVK